MLHEPKRNDTPLTALVQSIPEKRAFDLYLCYVRCCLFDVFPGMNNLPYQLFL